MVKLRFEKMSELLPQTPAAVIVSAPRDTPLKAVYYLFFAGLGAFETVKRAKSVHWLRHSLLLMPQFHKWRAA
jgi:hypothetical protein